MSTSSPVQLIVQPGGELCDASGAVPDLQSGQAWYVLRDADVQLSPDLPLALLRNAAYRRDVGIFYCDEASGSKDLGTRSLDLKPDFDLSLLIAQDYIGLPIAVRGDVLGQLAGLDARHGASASYDLLLRALSAGTVIARIPEILAFRSVRRPTVPRHERQQALEDWVLRSGGHYEVKEGRTSTSLRLERRFASMPEVTIVIPTCQSMPPPATGGTTDAKPFIIGLLASIARLNYPMDRIHVLVGDDVEDDAIYAGQDWPFHFQRVLTTRAPDETFNYASKMNFLWRRSRTKQIVFMNDDITTDATDWLPALLTFSMQEDVGGAGARLLYPDGTIQHAGIVGGLFGVCAHAWLGLPADAPTYNDWAEVQREWSIVTGAVFATRRSVLEEVNGFDEQLTLEFNDVDLCLRLRMLGYRIVYTPFAELIHHEKASRGKTLPPASQLALFLSRWQDFLRNDPSYNPHLTRTSFDIAPEQKLLQS